MVFELYTVYLAHGVYHHASFNTLNYTQCGRGLIRSLLAHVWTKSSIVWHLPVSRLFVLMRDHMTSRINESSPCRTLVVHAFSVMPPFACSDASASTAASTPRPPACCSSPLAALTRCRIASTLQPANALLFFPASLSSLTGVFVAPRPAMKISSGLIDCIFEARPFHTSVHSSSLTSTYSPFSSNVKVGLACASPG